MKINLNNNWEFARVGEQKKVINVPHDAMFFEERSNDSPGRVNTGWYLGYDYEYTKVINVTDYKQKVVILEFEGVYHNSEVFVNGEKACARPYGYTNFYVDLTKYVENNSELEIKVIAKNADQPNSRWYSGAGIIRPVNLLVMPKKHILVNGIKIKTVGITPPKIQMNVKTSCSGVGKVEIFDGDKLIYNTNVEFSENTKLDIALKGVSLWCESNPKLYRAKVTFESCEEEVNFGVRTVTCTAKDGLLLNGERIILKGACIHSDHGILGAACHPFADVRKIQIIKDSGYNAIRSAHNPISKATLDACDKLGIFVLDEYADMWYIHKTKYDYALLLEDWWDKDLTDMVDKDYNHPSVIMYSIGNEVAETAQKKGVELCDKMVKFLRAIDDRPVTCGINCFFNYLSQMGFGVYSDKKAEKSSKQKKHKAVGSEFFNKLAGLLGDKTMKIGATLHGSDKYTRDSFSKMDVAGYNYGILRYKKDIKKYPNRIILGTETFCKDAAHFMKLAKEHNQVIGDFVWAGMDYLGEVGIGSWEYSDYAKNFDHSVGWVSAGSGRIDLLGNHLSEMAYTRVAYELDKIRIGVVPPDNYKCEHSPSAWKMSNARESWSFEGYEGKKCLVEVYANAKIVDLLINGKTVGSKKVKNCVAKFEVKYASGTVEAVSYDENKNEIARTSLKSAESTTMLTAKAELSEINVDDLCYVDFSISDNLGEVKMLKKAKITVEVVGAELVSLGNACPYNEQGYHNNFAHTYYGKAGAIIRPSKAGQIKVIATSEFGSAEVVVNVK